MDKGSENESEDGTEDSGRNSVITAYKVGGENCGRSASPSGFTPLPLNQENIAVGLSWLWQTSAFSDLAISCNTYSFPVHKCILAAQCRYFNTLIRKPNRLMPTSTGSILELDGDDPEALKAMLQYLYTGVLVVPTTNVIILGGPEIPSIDILLKVHELGCKYELPQLKVQAAKQYIQVLETQWPKGHAFFLAKCLMKIFKMLEGAEEEGGWYANGAKELMDLTLSVAVKFMNELMSDSVVYDLLAGEPLRALVMRVSRRDSPVEAGAAVKSPISSPGVLPMPASGCSMEGFWR
jgi:hypothetical protein